MPNIREFSAPQNLGLSPSETGVDAVAKAAQRVGMFYNQFGNATSELGNEKGQMWRTLGTDAGSSLKDAGDVALKYQDHEQVSHGSAQFATVFNNLTNQYNAALKDADPNDPSFVAKFNETVVKPAMDKFKSGFSTETSQAWADAHANELQNHFMTKGAADLSTLAGIAVKQNYSKTVNNLSSAVATDPSSLDFALASVDHSVGAMVDSSPTMSATTAAAVKAEASVQAKEQIVKSAVSGMITKNPNIDLDAIQKKYGEYIKGDEIKMFQRAAQTQAKVDAYHDKSAAVAQKQLDDLNVHQGATKVITDNVKFDPTSGRPIIDPKYFNSALDIARKNPNAPSAAATVRTMLDWGESQLNKETKTVDDPTVKADLVSRLFDPDKPTTRQDLMKAQIDGKLSDHSFQSIERLVTEMDTSPLKGPVWQATAAAAKDALVVSIPGIPGKDTKGSEAYSSFMQSFIPQYLAKSRAGTLEPNALDTKDPDSMISKAMAPFKRTTAQRIQDYSASFEALGDKAGSEKPGPPIAPPTKVSSPSAAEKLSPGTRYQTPDGRVYVR